MIYMYLLKARTFIALLLVIAFFSVMVPNFLTEATRWSATPPRPSRRYPPPRRRTGQCRR
jgi:hypothetical protein